MAVDGHGRERHKKQWEQNEMYTNHAEHYLRQLASSYNVSVISLWVHFATIDILINCRRADNNNLSLSRLGLFEMSLDKRLMSYQDLSFMAENNPLCADERAAKSGD